MHIHTCTYIHIHKVIIIFIYTYIYKVLCTHKIHKVSSYIFGTVGNLSKYDGSVYDHVSLQYNKYKERNSSWYLEYVRLLVIIHSMLLRALLRSCGKLPAALISNGLVELLKAFT